MRRVELKEVHNFVCRGANLMVKPGELLVLLGSNGAGKTTLLNIIAGLVSYAGAVEFDGVPVDNVPARSRQVGYVFQDLVLFPHLDVTANIAYGLANTPVSRSQGEARIMELLDLLSIPHLAQRYPATLSGGEKQRVALARAIAPQPKILLLDEPFCSLDTRTSTFLRCELKQLQRKMGITTVFVTHDLQEAEQIADRIAVVQDGVVELIGDVNQVLLSPRTEKTAEFLGSPNILACTANRALGHGLTEVDCGGLRVVVPHNGKQIQRIVIWPRDVSLSTERPSSKVNVFAGTIQKTARQASATLVHVSVKDLLITTELPRTPHLSQRFCPGARVHIELNLMKIRAE